MGTRDGDRYKPGEVILQRYLVETMHRGGMGVIYLGKDLKTQQPVAIKTFEDRYLNSKRNRKIFLEEVCTWMELGSHPNIVRAYSVFLIDDKPYLLLERVASQDFRGATLKDYIFSTSVEEKEILQIGIHICNGMLHALRKFPGFLHRDLKTENILMAKGGVAKISDFGLTMHKAAALKNGEDEERAPRRMSSDRPNFAHLKQQMEGAPAFASPEQCLGKPLDTRSDLYSFGCILYTLVTKNPPFARATVEETLEAQLNDIPVEPIQKNSSIQPSLSKLIMECLAKEPHQRASSFAVVRNRLVGIYHSAYGDEPLSFTQETPLSAEEYIEQSESFESLGEWNRAERALLAAIQVKDDWPAPYIRLARVVWAQGNSYDALKRLETALAYDSTNPEAHETMAIIHAQLHNWNKAESSCRRAIEHSPCSAAVYCLLADILIHQDRCREAETLLQRGLKNASDRLPLYRALAQLYRRVCEERKERDALTHILNDRSDDIDLMLRAAELSIVVGDMPSFRKWTQRSSAANPTDGDALFRLGKLLIAMKNKTQAYETFQKAIRHGCRNGRVYVELAQLDMERRNPDSAWRNLLEAEKRGVDVDALKRTISISRLRNSIGRA